MSENQTSDQRIQAARAENAAAREKVNAVLKEFAWQWQGGKNKDTMTALRNKLAAAKQRVKVSEEELKAFLQPA
jgi:hypothetical protein